MASELKKKTVKGVVWSGLNSFSVQGVQFLVMLVMARLLTPSDYGLVGMIVIFTAIASLFIDSGLGNALIRKLDRTEADNSTVFLFNVAVGLLMYIILFFSAPYVADFYNMPLLCPVMRVSCIGIMINALTAVQGAMYNINLDFKTPAIISFSTSIVSGIVGITMAYIGMGVWALVIQGLTGGVLRACLIWILSKWRPKLIFSWQSFKDLFGYSSKLLVSGLLDCIYNNIYPIVIGKFFSAANLGLYNRAQHFANLPSKNLTSIVRGVTFPVLCKLQNDDEKLALNYRRLLKMITYLVFPMMLLLATLSYPVVITLVGERWAFCAILLPIICIARMWYPVHSINLNLLQVKGRSDLFLRLEVIKKVVGVAIMVITIPMGIIAMCCGQIVSSIICLIINTYYTGKLIKVGFFVQIKDMAPCILLSVAACAGAYLTAIFLPNAFLQMVGGGIVGVLLYVAGSYLFRFYELKELVNIVRKRNI